MSPTHKFTTVHREWPSQHFAPQSSLNLFNEDERLKTFTDWPTTVIKPEELASNGFYYTGTRDVTRCAFCGLEVGEWVTGDTAATDHQKYAPECDFVRGRPCGNVKKGTSSSASSCSSSPPSYDTCGPYGFLLRPYSAPEQSVLSLIGDFDKIGVNRTNGPVKPDYATKEARLKSFTNWPTSCPIRPETLADAGFYSEGHDDATLCFYCGGGLKNWEQHDDPWIEHARWFSQCAYVTMHKGHAFVSRARQAGPAVLPVSTVNELMHHKRDVEEEEKVLEENARGVDVAGNVEPKGQIAAPKSELEICKVCYERDRNILFIPCGHLVACAACASSIDKCPVCREKFYGTYRAYLS